MFAGCVDDFFSRPRAVNDSARLSVAASRARASGGCGARTGHTVAASSPRRPVLLLHCQRGPRLSSLASSVHRTPFTTPRNRLSLTSPPRALSSKLLSFCLSLFLSRHPTSPSVVLSAVGSKEAVNHFIYRSCACGSSVTLQ